MEDGKIKKHGKPGAILSKLSKMESS